MTAVQTNGEIKGFALNDKQEPIGQHTNHARCTETGLDGPDQILPADDYVATKSNDRVRIRFNDNSLNSEAAPLSVPGLLKRTATMRPNGIALVARLNAQGERKTYTYSEYEHNVRIVAKAFLKLGLERHHSVCILGFNSPEWFFSDLAAIYAGGIAVGVYTTNTPDACRYCAENSKANIIVVEDAKQLEKILQIRNNLPDLKAIIMYGETPEHKDVLSWDDVMQMGEAESDDKLNEVLKKIGVNECCTLVYTSGTVGNPKGVMLSHDNLVQDAQIITKFLKLGRTDHILIGYLPLSHVAAQIIDIYCCMTIGATLYFADRNALKGTLVDTMLAARPTVFVGVPRVWEKICEKMQAVARSNGLIKTWIASWAKAQGLYYYTNKMNGNDFKHWSYLFARWLIFSKIRIALGLDRCEVCITAAAPLSVEVKQYLMSLDIPLLDAYGMSECSGAHTLCTNEHFRLGSVGLTLPEFETKLNESDSEGEGEICIRGRHVFMGYLNESEKTVDILKPDGWLHTGDIGKLDSDGLLYVTGRIKELIITAGGENIPPVHIEQLVLAELSVLSNVMLIGDKRRYLTMVVTLKSDMNADTGEPEDTVTSDTLKWMKSIGSQSKTISDVINTRDPLVYDEIDKAIKRANNKVISNAQKIQKFQILPHDFSVPTGELGPTLKLKRNVVYTMYESLIEEMYK
ncbi:acyl-CoA synthetase bubblegum family member 1 isoform X3 [Andrena cerasifolii]